MPDQEIIEAPAPRAGVVGEGLERLVPQDMAQLAWMAKTLASSGMFLKSLAQGRTAPLNAAETFVVMQEGIGLGLSPLQALREIAVVESRGRLTTIPSARVVSGRIQADPRLESWEATGDATSFTVKAKRKGRPAIEVTVSVEEFSQAEVNRHLEHLEDWLFARAVRRLARRGFSDMLLGIYVGGEPEVVDAVTVNVAALERDAGTDGAYGRHEGCGGEWILRGSLTGGAYLRCSRCGDAAPPPQEIRDAMRGRAEEYRIEAPAPTQSPTQPPLEEGERPITPADLEGVATAVPEAPEGLPIGNPVPGVPHPIDVPDIDPERGAETAQEAGGALWDRNDALARLMERIGEMRHGPYEAQAELKNALAQMGWQERTPLGGWVVAQTDEVVLDLAVKLGDGVNVGMTEDQLLTAVLDLAKNLGWRSLHIRPPASARSTVQGDGKGFPDLLLIRGSEILVAELKDATGRVDPRQRAWLNSFEAAGIHAYVWRPADWPWAIPSVLLGH